jgi:hypothetical protein
VYWELKKEEEERAKSMKAANAPRFLAHQLNYDAAREVAFGVEEVYHSADSEEDEDDDDTHEAKKIVDLGKRLTSAHLWGLHGGITGAEAYKLVLDDELKKLDNAKAASEKREKREEEKREKVKRARVEAGPLLERFKASRRGEHVRKVTGPDLKKILIAFGIAILPNSKTADLEKLIVDNDLAE